MQISTSVLKGVVPAEAFGPCFVESDLRLGVLRFAHELELQFLRRRRLEILEPFERVEQPRPLRDAGIAPRPFFGRASDDLFDRRLALRDLCLHPLVDHGRIVGGKLLELLQPVLGIGHLAFATIHLLVDPLRQRAVVHDHVDHRPDGRQIAGPQHGDDQRRGNAERDVPTVSKR
jgi:hypothetical protein